MTEPAVLLFIVVVGTLASTVLSSVAGILAYFRSKRQRHAPPAEWPDNLFYFGLATTWIIAAAVGQWVYP